MDKVSSLITYVNKRMPAYFKTTPVLLKLWCLVFNLLAFATNLMPFENQVHFTLRPSFEFDEVALAGFAITAILLLIFYHDESGCIGSSSNINNNFIQQYQQQQKLQWIKIEMYFCGLWAVLYAFVITLITIGNVACLKRIQQSHMCASHILATAFGFLAMVGYVGDCLMKHRELRRRGITRSGTNLFTTTSGSIRQTEFFNTTDQHTIMCH